MPAHREQRFQWERSSERGQRCHCSEMKITRSIFISERGRFAQKLQSPWPTSERNRLARLEWATKYLIYEKDKRRSGTKKKKNNNKKQKKNSSPWLFSISNTNTEMTARKSFTFKSGLYDLGVRLTSVTNITVKMLVRCIKPA